MPVPTHTWKSTERKVAAFFYARRTPLSGANSGHDTHSDTLSEHFYLEVKRRKKHYVHGLFFAELPKARAEGKPLILALQQHRQTNPPWLMVIDPREIHKISRLLKKAKRSYTAWKQKKHPGA